VDRPNQPARPGERPMVGKPAALGQWQSFLSPASALMHLRNLLLFQEAESSTQVDTDWVSVAASRQSDANFSFSDGGALPRRRYEASAPSQIGLLLERPQRHRGTRLRIA